MSKLTAELAYELGYQRALDDLHTYYRQAYNLAIRAIECNDNRISGPEIRDELEYLDRRYERARNAVTEHDDK